MLRKIAIRPRATSQTPQAAVSMTMQLEKELTGTAFFLELLTGEKPLEQGAKEQGSTALVCI